MAAGLGRYFSDDHIKEMRDYGLDLGRMWRFIRDTEKVGGQVAKLTLATPAWIKLFKMDEDAKFLIEGVAYGFDWPATDPPAFYETPNYVEQEHHGKVSDRVAEELAAGRIAPTMRDRVTGIAAIGVVDKQRSGFVKYRVVHDLSRPHGASVNDGIDMAKRKFASFASACNYLRPRAYMCKIDLANAYRSVPMRQHWWPRHALQWEGVVYQDLRMPFGNRGAPAAFDRITQAVVRRMKADGYPSFVGYLDDFLLVVQRTVGRA